MNTTASPPTVTHYEIFEAVYLAHLADPDRPSCYIAYCRAESEHEAEHGHRRWATHASFMAARAARAKRRARQNTPAAPPESQLLKPHGGKVPINCQLCYTELFTVPRGDLRTIIPHFCEGCRDEIRKLIFV